MRDRRKRLSTPFVGAPVRRLAFLMPGDRAGVLTMWNLSLTVGLILVLKGGRTVTVVLMVEMALVFGMEIAFSAREVVRRRHGPTVSVNPPPIRPVHATTSCFKLPDVVCYQ